MRYANRAEENYRELHTRWSLAQRASAQAKIQKRRRDSSVER